MYVTSVESLNLITDPKCNKILNVITFHPKCNKVLNVITFGVTFELLSVTTFGLKWYDRWRHANVISDVSNAS